MIHNWTKHEITIKALDGEVVSIPSSGIDARIRTTEQPAGVTIHVVDGVRREFALSTVLTHEIVGIDVRTGQEVELPRLLEGDIAVVSGMVKDQVPNNPQIVAPNTGDSAVRNKEKNRIVYVSSLVIKRTEA